MDWLRYFRRNKIHPLAQLMTTAITSQILAAVNIKKGAETPALDDLTWPPTPRKKSAPPSPDDMMKGITLGFADIEEAC